RAPGRTDGATTKHGMWLLGPASVPPFSSQTTNSASVPAAYSGLASTLGTKPASQRSPSATVPSCMSWTRFGVTKVSAASKVGLAGSGTSCAAHALASAVKYVGGLWRTAYGADDV